MPRTDAELLRDARLLIRRAQQAAVEARAVARKSESLIAYSIERLERARLCERSLMGSGSVDREESGT